MAARWSTLEVFKHFGKVKETRLEARGEWLRILGNGGLFVKCEAGSPGNGWHCMTDDLGGDQFDAWQYCRHNNTNVPKDARFAELLREMAEAGGLAIPERKTRELQEPEFEPLDLTQLDQHAPAEELLTTSPAAAGQPAAPGTVKTFADMAEVIGPIEWDWRGWLPKGLLTILAGESGAGKSSLALRLAACYLRGDPWPDGSPYTGEPGAVLWCEAEAAQAVNLQRAAAWGLPLGMLYTPLDNPLDDLRLDNAEHRAILTTKASRPEVRMIVTDSLRGVLGRAR